MNTISIEHQDSGSRARNTILRLPHGDVQTPAFMPVGTNGSVKAIHHSTLESYGFNLILGNTYHLYLRPGIEIIKEYGSLHKFTSWNRNILTDSGGYQVFSLAPFRKIREEGVRFRSHIDGSYHNLTPESVLDLQTAFESDIMMVLDVCTAPDLEYKKALSALITTSKWAQRSIDRYRTNGAPGLLFGIIQGNFYKDLRKRSAEELIEMDFPGYAIGGLSVGETFDQFLEYLEYSAEFLPQDKPRYLMGIGTPEYILAAVENGIDIFDCVFPTRTARNGLVFTDQGAVNLKKIRFASDQGPIQEGCGCAACTRYSTGYLRQMFKANEIYGPMLATEHNLYFLKNFMDRIRLAIAEDRFNEFKTEFLSQYASSKTNI
jgi:queuine tRNA-ribosyltransferase